MNEFAKSVLLHTERNFSKIENYFKFFNLTSTHQFNNTKSEQMFKASGECDEYY